MSLSESKHFLDGYEQAYNLQRALPRGPIRRQAAIDALNVLDILGFSTGAGFLVVSEGLLFSKIVYTLFKPCSLLAYIHAPSWWLVPKVLEFCQKF